MTATIKTRLGDGSLIELSPADLRVDLESGTAAAATRAKVAPLTEDELAHLFDIFASNSRFTGVDIGDEVVLSIDGSGNADSGSVVDGLLQWQNHLGADIVELWNHDYSFKAVKTVLSFETQAMRRRAAEPGRARPVRGDARPRALLDARRTRARTGPSCSPRAGSTRLVRRRSSPSSTPSATWCSSPRACGRPGPTPSISTRQELRATPTSSRRCGPSKVLPPEYPDIGIEVGMATEFVLGMHGELAYAGRRLAGMWAADQLAMATQAGATVFGPAVTVDTGPHGRLEHRACPHAREALRRAGDRSLST